ADFTLFAAKILQFLTSSDDRRLGEYDQMSWWTYLQGDDYSPKFQRQLRAVPRTMVAMEPRHGSAKTVGRISMQLSLDHASPGVITDCTLGGPTSDRWIDPWIAYLSGRGVQFHPGTAVAGLDVAGGKISGVRLAGGGPPMVADHYVLAVPLDAAIGLI